MAQQDVTAPEAAVGEDEHLDAHQHLHHHPHHRPHHGPRPRTVVGSVVGALAVYEVGAYTVNRLLEEDVVPSISPWLIKPFWPKVTLEVRHVAWVAASWGVLGAVAVGGVALRTRVRR